MRTAGAAGPKLQASRCANAKIACSSIGTTTFLMRVIFESDQPKWKKSESLCSHRSHRAARPRSSRDLSVELVPDIEGEPISHTYPAASVATTSFPSGL